MYIKQLRFKNTGPFGNILYTFNFDSKNDVGELWQILGKNGVGKSYFLKIIKLGLYLETDGILTSEISNDINGDGYIDITYDSKGHTWRNESVYGKSKLKSLKIYKDGKDEPEDYGGNQDTKRHLLEHILDMPYYIFNNAVSLSVNDFKSFLSMNTKDTRNIRDRIFGFFIVNEMMEIIRKTLNKHIRQQEDIINSLKTLSESIETTNIQYEETKKTAKENDTEALKILNIKLLEYQNGYNDTKEKIEKKEKELAEWELILEYIDDEANKKELEALKTKNQQLTKNIENITNDKINKEDEIKLLNTEKEVLILKEAKEKINKAKEDIKIVEKKLINLKESEKLAKQNMDDMQTSMDDMEENNKNNTVVSDMISSINNLYSSQQTLAEYNNKEKNLIETEETIRRKREETDAKIIELNAENENLDNRKMLIESGKCDKCETDLTTNEFVEEKSGIVERIAEIGVLLDGRKKVLDKIKESEGQLSENKTKVSDAITKHSSAVSSAITTLKMLVPKDNSKFDPYKKFIFAIIEEVLVDVPRFQKIATDNSFTKYDDKKIDESKLKFEELKNDHKIADKKYEETNTEVVSKQSSINTLSEQLKDVDKETWDKELKFSKKDEYQTKIDDVGEIVKSKNIELINLNKSSASTETEIKNLEKLIKSDGHFKELNNDLVDNDLVDNDLVEDTEKNITYISEKVSTINSNMDILGEKSTEFNGNIISTNTSINNINKQKDNNQLESIKKIIEGFEIKHKTHQENDELLQKKVNFIKMLEYVLSDECVKAYMLREIVPTINNEIANMLMALGVNLTIVFNDEFKPTIFRFGSEASLGSISTGQKKMVDASILMSITILLLMRYGKFNLVSYDEIFSSLHSTSISIMLELIKEKLCKKLKLNVILINHSYMSSSFFDKIGYIFHKDNFSFLNIMKPDDYEMMEMTGQINTGEKTSKEELEKIDGVARAVLGVPDSVPRKNFD